MKFENTTVCNFEGALRGMRNPMNSWDKADSEFDCMHNPFFIGENDMKLARQLIKAGNEHRKFLRQIFISVDISAPIYWWKEFDTYKVGTVSNSTSTMHKLASTPITIDCFEMGDFEDVHICREYDEDFQEYACKYHIKDMWGMLIGILEDLRQEYNITKNKAVWKELIRMLPESWLQKRTITMNYENLYSMMKQRKNHKLVEWSKDFMEWAENLPYVKELFNE